MYAFAAMLAAAPVVIAHVRPDPFDHVRFCRQWIDDRPCAPALAPAYATFLGNGFATVVVLASDALVQDDLLGNGSR